MYRTLNPDKTIATLKTLSNRIEERFPGAGLSKVCRELLAIAEETTGRIAWVSKRHAGIRLAVLLVVGITVWLGWFVVRRVRIHTEAMSIEELEAATNAVVLIGAALFFLFSLESRIKRRRVMSALNELRAISHVIDMHQLTKDPIHITTGIGQRTRSSPQQSLTPFELTRYLDYCSEMLSLIGKLAALYAQSDADGVILQAVNEIETLTSGISRKIWQKIMMLDDDVTAESEAAIRHRSDAATTQSLTKPPDPPAAGSTSRLTISEPK